MFAMTKRKVIFAAAVGGLAYLSQFYTLSGWRQLRIESVAEQQSAHDAPSQPVVSSMFDQHAASTNEPRPFAIGDALASFHPSKLISLGTAGPIKQRIPTIRIASFNLDGFDERKLSRFETVDVIARIFRSMDVIAVQQIQSRQKDILPRLIDAINQSDRHFDFCVGPRVGQGSDAQQFAFLFDTDTIETDRHQLYTLNDPQHLIEYDPLVGWFRTTCVPANEAFTFSLVNLRIDPKRAEEERKLLPDLIRSIRRDGRSEDDVIVAGDFCGSDRSLSPLANIGMTSALEGIATHVGGDQMLDNILVQTTATDEFDGRSGAIDFLREFNLTIQQANQISSHLPIWAEFIAIEGGTPGRKTN